MIPYGRQSISQNDIDAVVDVLMSDFITQGPRVPKFEQKMSEYSGALYSVAVNSATSALHLACLALNLGKGDSLWTSPNTFVASANCALYCGAQVDFVDIDPDTYNMSLFNLEEKLKHARKINQLPKILVAVHFAGQSCDVEAIYKLSKEYGFKIIEDASHALGANYKDTRVGCCKYSDITIFSFHPVKIITTGEGGMALTNDKKIAIKIAQLRSHGITFDSDEMQTKPISEIWNYQQIDLGFNYRMTEIQAALGISQMDKLNSFIKKRKLISNTYDKELKSTPLLLPLQACQSQSSWHLYVVRVKKKDSYLTQRYLYTELRKLNIGVNIHYIPVYLHPYYKKLGFPEGYCPKAENFFQEALSIPIFPDLTSIQQEFVITAIKNLFKS